MDGAFNLPFKLEQGRPPPARASSVPRQPDSLLTPTPEPTPTPTEPPTLESNAASDEPTGLNAFPIAYSVIEIRWGQPGENVDGFEVEVSPDGSDDSWRRLAGKEHLTYSSGRLYTWTQEYGLQRNQTRYYRLRASIGGVWGAWSDAGIHRHLFHLRTGLVGGRPGHECPENHLARAQRFRHDYGLDPAGKGGRPPRRGDEGWTPLSSTLAAEDRSYVHSGLEPGDTRYYRIRANTGVGTAQWSVGPDHATTLTDVIPAAPVLTARATGALEIELSWTKPDGRGFPITGYEWQESPDGIAWGRSWSGFAADLGAQDNVDRPGTTRHYRVRAKTVKGLGPWSRTVKVTTENGGAGEPTNLKAVEVGDTWVKLKWEAPTQVGAGILGYQVQQKDPSSIKEVWKNVGATDASTLTFKDTGLVSAEGYQHRVAARDSGGLGPWTSPYSDAITKPSLPAAPKLTAKAETLDGGPGQNDNPYHQWVALTWTVPTTVYGIPQEIDYEVERSGDGKKGWAFVKFVQVRNGYKDHDLNPGDTWYYRVRATIDPLDYGYGPWSNTVSATVRAALPENLPYMTAEAGEEDRSIKISWNPPKTDGGSRITRYEIQVSTEGHSDGSKFKPLTSSSASGAYIHRNLQPDTRYCYRYRARNSVGWSQWSWGSDEECFRTGLINNRHAQRNRRGPAERRGLSHRVEPGPRARGKTRRSRAGGNLEPGAGPLRPRATGARGQTRLPRREPRTRSKPAPVFEQPVNWGEGRSCGQCPNRSPLPGGEGQGEAVAKIPSPPGRGLG